MSEFSDSFHLRTDRVDDGVALLRRADVEGFVFPPAAGWTALVAAGDGTAVVAANRGRLVRYTWASDHGCSVVAFDAAVRVAVLELNFETPKVRFDREAFIQHRFLTAADAQRLEAWLVSSTHVAAELAAAFGLTRCSWFSWAYELDALEPVEGRLELVRSAPRAAPAQSETPRDFTDELQALADLTDTLVRRAR